jgi:tetratricopeptide (TPR) repeat protein
MNRSASSPWRSPAGIAIAVIALFLAWRCVTLGMADVLVTSDAAAAVSWRTANPDAEYALAQADFLARRDAAAIDRARRSVVADPLDGRGYRIAAALAERAGERDRAEQLFELAQQRASRDLPTRIKLATYALQIGDHERAIHEMDMLLRMQPELDTLVVGRMVKLTADPSSVPLLLQALSHHPGWRYWFLSALAIEGPDTGNATRIFDALASLEPLTPNEAKSRAKLQQRIADAAHAAAPRAAGAVSPDWYALMDWGAVERDAYIYSEDPYDSVGTP